MPSALVVGLGSIGERHARLLSELGHDVAVVSRRGLGDKRRSYPMLGDALAAERPDYVVVANATAEHHPTLAALASAGFAGRVLRRLQPSLPSASPGARTRAGRRAANQRACLCRAIFAGLAALQRLPPHRLGIAP